MFEWSSRHEAQSVCPGCYLVKAMFAVRSNVLPMHVDLNKDYFTESSRSALKAVFASWSLEQCKIWYAPLNYVLL